MKWGDFTELEYEQTRDEYAQISNWFFGSDQESMFAYEVLCWEVEYRPKRMRKRLLKDVNDEKIPSLESLFGKVWDNVR